MRILAFTAIVLAGCSPTPTAPSVPQLEVKLPVVAAVEPPMPKPDTPKSEAAPAVPFLFANDAGGKAVEKTLLPKFSAVPGSRVQSPTARTSDIERGEVGAAKPSATAAPLPTQLRKTSLPTPPKEGASAELGVGQEIDLRDRKLPESPTVKAAPRPVPTAKDVPRMGYPFPDKISTEDSTVEISTSRIVQTLMTAPTIAVPFLRLVLPDPFEFAAQIRPPTAPEFATAPVFVPSAKP